VCFLASGCATVSKEEIAAAGSSRMEDPSQSLWITIESIPSGATVYGVQNGQPGTRLGTTPLTLKYTRAYGRIYGNMPDETLAINEEDSWPWSLSKAFLAFKCIVLKDGYHPYRINQVVENSGGSWGPFALGHVKSLDGGYRKTFTAILSPVSPPSVQQTPVQQQQQQQQTVVIPDYGKKESLEKGTVMVTSVPENAEVNVDGVFVGNAPCTLPLTEGIHIIEIKLSGYRSFKKEMRIISGGKVTICATLDKE